MVKKTKPIAVTLALISILLALVIGILLSSFQIYRDYHQEEKSIQNRVEKVLKVSERSAIAAVYTLSESLAKEVIIGLLEYDFIYEAKIIDDLENTLAQEKRSQTTVHKTQWLTNLFPDRSNTFSIALYQSGMNIQKPGKLIVNIDRNVALSSFYSRFFTTLSSRIIENLMLVLLLYFAFHIAITRPIVNLAHAFKQIKPGRKTHQEISIPGNHQGNELGKLTESANKLIKENERHIEEIQETETKFRNIVEGSVQGIYIHDNFMPLFANQICADIFGYADSDEILSLPSLLASFYDPNEHIRIERYKNDLLANREAPSAYEFQGVRKDGTTIWLEQHVTAINWQGTRAIQCVVVDISERKKASEELSYYANHDSLTGLLNRRAFEHSISCLLTQANDLKQAHALCFMDLDQFKVVNDTCGHAAGDQLLQLLSIDLQKILRKTDVLARLGGDEFGVLIERCGIKEAEKIAKHLQKTVRDFQFWYEGNSFKIGVSIGVVPISPVTVNIDGILSKADAACYQAKDNGRNRIHIYNPDDTEIAQRQGEMQWVARINNALAQNLFCLYAQAIESLGSDTHRHYEILIRLKEDNDKIIGPHAFLPAAERFDMMSNIDMWVIKHIFDALINSTLRQHLDNTFISINLSGQSLNNNKILKYIVRQINETSIKGEMLCFEITETAAISNIINAQTFIATLKALGCRFALDDFGSGLSSFAYLKNLPVDYLKIDGLFVKNIITDPIDHAMVKSINEIGQIMGMKTIAEFVENDEIKDSLKHLGVDYAQGYGVHKPQALEELLLTLDKQ